MPVTITQALLGFAAIAAILTVIPGIDTTLVLRATLVHGRRHGAATAIGICVGVFCWGAAAAVGAAALLAASELAFRLVTVAGAVYMVVLGLRMLVRAARHDAGHGPAGSAVNRGAGRALVTGFTTNVLNPKIGVFYIATIPQFIPRGVPPLGMGLLLASVHVAMGLVWLGLIIVGAGRARRWLAHERGIRIVDAVGGSVLVALGARLALSHR